MTENVSFFKKSLNKGHFVAKSELKVDKKIEYLF